MNLNGPTPACYSVSYSDGNRYVSYPRKTWQCKIEKREDGNLDKYGEMTSVVFTVSTGERCKTNHVTGKSYYKLMNPSLRGSSGAYYGTGGGKVYLCQPDTIHKDGVLVDNVPSNVPVTSLNEWDKI